MEEFRGTIIIAERANEHDILLHLNIPPGFWILVITSLGRTHYLIDIGLP
jgi:hypothetical protein